MKGVINKGIQELVESQFGKDTWETICQEANCDEPLFSPGLEYPDQMTIDLVTAAAKHTDLSADAVMIEFGKYWIPNTGRESHPALYALAGRNARDFLAHAERIHTQVTKSISGAHPPKLSAEDLPDGGLAIHYVSARGLCPVVHGLILGVGVHFGQPLDVTETCCTRRGDPECVFEVRFP